jgi:hypothetical protein
LSSLDVTKSIKKPAKQIKRYLHIFQDNPQEQLSDFISIYLPRSCLYFIFKGIYRVWLEHVYWTYVYQKGNELRNFSPRLFLILSFIKNDWNLFSLWINTTRKSQFLKLTFECKLHFDMEVISRGHGCCNGLWESFQKFVFFASCEFKWKVRKGNLRETLISAVLRRNKLKKTRLPSLAWLYCMETARLDSLALSSPSNCIGLIIPTRTC